MSRHCALAWRVTVLVVAALLIQGLAASRGKAPAVSEDVLTAPDIADRESDSYTVDAFIWRDSMPLVITGLIRMKICVKQSVYQGPTLATVTTT